MPTDLDDDTLARELGVAFRASTADLRYSGRRRPPVQPVAALPALGVAATVAAVAVVAIHGGTSTGGETPSAGGHTLPVAPSTTSGAGVQTIRLAGFSIRYERTADGRARGVKLVVPADDSAPDTLHVQQSVDLPYGARPVKLADSDARAWIGKSPTTGDNTLYVRAPGQAGGPIFAVVAPGWTTDQLVDLLTDPRPVPAVD
jgi:hypothetical protein